MRKIIQLSEDVVAKIAAGEVVERPAYAIKELVENSIDALADVIEVHIEESGLRKISVYDNGEGMGREDLEMSFLPHTTSKIKQVDELIGIKTLGFRGEALSSIASVSHMTIQSRQKGDIGGTIIKVQEGVLKEVSSVGTPRGTIVHVEHLFSSVPVRKKFLKTAKTELRHIIQVISYFALAHPEIHFVLTHNKKSIFDLRRRENILERVKFIHGDALYNNLIPVRFEDGYIRVDGFIGKPQAALKNNQKQYIFVNNRFVSDKLISFAIREAYGSLLPAVNTPIFVLYISLPHEVVDVNIHPRKEHIAFTNRKIIFDALKLATIQTLNKHNLTFRLAKFKEETSGLTSETTSFASLILKNEVLVPEEISLGLVTKHSECVQIANTYICTVTENGLLLLDQHAAHERVLFESFVDTFEKQRKKKNVVILKKPVTIQISIVDSHVYEEYKGMFEKMGFEIEHFPGTGMIVRVVPSVFKGRNIEKIIQDMLIDFSENRSVSPIDQKSTRMLAFLSCRSAVKRGDPLSKAQMQELVQKLQKTRNNVTCPHGRPTKIAVTVNDLEKMFRRK